jgi:hypothetical protein
MVYERKLILVSLNNSNINQAKTQVSAESRFSFIKNKIFMFANEAGSN